MFSDTAARIAVRSPYGTISNPGVYGPKSARASWSVEKLMTVVVRPWKLLPATTIFARPSGTPLTRYPHFRAVFTAVSTASAPVFIGSTISMPHSDASSRQKSANRSWWNARDVSVTRSSCAFAASTSRRLPWPKLSAE